MNSLEEYTAFASTITDLMRDGEDILMIENIQNCVKDAKRQYHDEQLQYQNEIERLLERVEGSRNQARRSTTKEEHQAQYENLQKQHQTSLQNISNLQEQRLLLQKQINKLKKAPSLVAKQEEIKKLSEKMNLEDQKVRLYMNTFKGLNWEFGSEENKISGYYVAQDFSSNSTQSFKPFSFDTSTSTQIAVADSLWEEIM